MLVCAHASQHKDLKGRLLGTEKGKRTARKEAGMGCVCGGSVWEVVLVTAETELVPLMAWELAQAPLLPDFCP